MQTAINFLTNLPLEWFVLIGSFIEELISPIPSFMVLVPAGAGLNAQAVSAWYIIVLSLIAGVGRVLGALILYWLSGRLRGFMFARRSRWLGLGQANIDRFSQQLGRGRAWWLLFAMWAIPIFPGTPISVASGYIKVPLLIFITATFWGSVVNACFYLYLGYLGLGIATGVQEGLDWATQIVILLILVALLVVIRRRRSAQAFHSR